MELFCVKTRVSKGNCDFKMVPGDILESTIQWANVSFTVHLASESVKGAHVYWENLAWSLQIWLRVHHKFSFTEKNWYLNQVNKGGHDIIMKKVSSLKSFPIYVPAWGLWGQMISYRFSIFSFRFIIVSFFPSSFDYLCKAETLATNIVSKYQCVIYSQNANTEETED